METLNLKNSQQEKICFFAKVDEPALNVVNFYKQDIDILSDLGYRVKIATKWSKIDWSCNIIYIWWWTWAFIPVFVAKLLRKKVIITGTFNFICPSATSDYFRRPWYEKLLIQYSVKNADKNIFVSEVEMKQILEYWQLKNCVYSPHIVQTEIYYPTESVGRKNDLLLSIVWSQKTNLERKCVFDMINVVGSLLNEGYNIRYYIAGRRGDGFESLQNFINDKKLSEHVFLCGEISEKQKIQLMRECTIYFQISKFEGFGLAIAEAMACGAPIVSSYVGEIPNVVAESGVLCSGYSLDEIKNCVKKLLDNKDERIKISKQASLRIAENFNYNRRLNDIKNIIGELS